MHINTALAILTEGTTSSIDTVIGAVSKVMTLAGELLEGLVSNPITLFFLAASLVPIGFRIIKKMKHTAMN